MRRISSFSRISFYLALLLGIGFTTDYNRACTALDYLQQEIIRDNLSARQAQTNPTKQKEIRERTDPPHPCYP